MPDIIFKTKKEFLNHFNGRKFPKRTYKIIDVIEILNDKYIKEFRVDEVFDDLDPYCLVEKDGEKFEILLTTETVTFQKVNKNYEDLTKEDAIKIFPELTYCVNCL